jgi:hypothetical protein
MGAALNRAALNYLITPYISKDKLGHVQKEMVVGYLGYSRGLKKSIKRKPHGNDFFFFFFLDWATYPC